MNNAKLHPGLADLVVAQYVGPRDPSMRYDGRGHAQFIGGHMYNGEFKDGMMDGDGVYKWFDGTVFSGSFYRNSISGFGTYTWADGTVYVGSVFHGLRHGQGTLKGANGFPRYEGAWFRGHRHGFGTLSYNTEGTSRYEGNWADDNREGRGIMYYPSGNLYSGEWRKGIKCGVGKMLWHDRGERYIGNWNNDQQNGQGEHVWMELQQPEQQWSGTQRHMCNRFRGQWESGLRHGIGTFYYANGARYSGEWVRGIKQGSGLFIHDDGTLYAGKFWQDHAQRDASAQCETIDMNRIQPNVHLHIGDVLGEGSAMILEKNKLQKIILRVNSELKTIYQTYVTNDTENGIFAMPLQQFHLFCVHSHISPTMIPTSSVTNILLALRRQHNAVINMAVLKNGANTEQNMHPGYLAMSYPQEHENPINLECQPLLYREFVEAVVRIATMVAAQHTPELVPSCAFQELVVQHIRPLSQALDKPERVSRGLLGSIKLEGSLCDDQRGMHPSNYATVSFQKALTILLNIDSGEVDTDEYVERVSLMHSSLCVLAKSHKSQEPMEPLDIKMLLISANTVFVLSEIKSLAKEKCGISISDEILGASSKLSLLSSPLAYTSRKALGFKATCNYRPALSF